MKTFLTVSATLLVLASSCDSYKKSENISLLKEIAPQEAVVENSAAPATAADQKQEEQFQQKQVGQQPNGKQFNEPGPVEKINWDKKIIKKASLEMEVKDFQVFGRNLYGIAGKYGGYIAEENQNSSEYKKESKAVIRIPVDQFDAAVTELTGNAEKLLGKTISSQDVTGEMVDIKARLEARRQARLRYIDLMKQAKNMEEVFLVQKEVDGIQEQIEAAAGRIGYLSHASAYSTIELTWFQILNPSLKDDQQPSFGGRLLDAFGAGFQWLGDLLIALITLWPIWLLVSVIWIGFRKWKGARKNRQALIVTGEEK